jgi:hypothetical protein
MNQAFLCAQLLENPREVSVSNNNYETHCKIALPPVGKKRPTVLDFAVTNKQGPRFLQQFKEGDLIYIHGAVLLHDHLTSTHSLRTDYGTSIDKVTQDFGIKNTVILSGSMIKNLDPTNEMDVRYTDNGYCIWSQSMSVKTFGKNFNLYNLKAISQQDERYNLAKLCITYLNTRGQSATVTGQLVTDGWLKKETGEQAERTEIIIRNMTLPRKPPASEKRVEPQTAVAASSTPATLWGGKTLGDDLC